MTSPSGAQASAFSAPLRNSIINLTSAAIAALAICASVVPALALDEIPDEEAKLKACEQSLCTMVIAKPASGDGLTCNLSKTWAKEKLSKGAKEKSLDWGFGDARCGVDLEASRDLIVNAVTKPAHTLALPKHTVKCEIERGEEVTKINISMAPKIEFKDGKAQKAWLNIGDIEAPTVVKGAIWTAAKLEDNFGLFHSEIIEEVNDFIHKKCPKRYPEVAAQKDEPAKKAEAAK